MARWTCWANVWRRILDLGDEQFVVGPVLFEPFLGALQGAGATVEDCLLPVGRTEIGPHVGRHMDPSIFRDLDQLVLVDHVMAKGLFNIATDLGRFTENS